MDALACALRLAKKIEEHPRAPSGVAAFLSAHSKTPHSTPSMEVLSGQGVIWGRMRQQLEFAVPPYYPFPRSITFALPGWLVRSGISVA